MTHANPDNDGPDRDDQTHHDASKDSEEPVPTQENSVPSDGKDVEGEDMMKSVRNELLKEPPPPA